MSSGRRYELIAAEAADWVIALREGDTATRAAFSDWLRASPEHIREFLAVLAIWDALPHVAHDQSTNELVRFARTQGNVIPVRGFVAVPRREAPGKPFPWRRWAGRAAAAVLLVCASVVLLVELRAPDDRHLHVTGTGEQASIPLPDGSLVTLNTRSTLRVAYSEEHRDIFLRDGEALFEVAEAASRPFRVTTRHAVIEALGTQFNVRVDAADVSITVVEGVVAVSAVDRQPEGGSTEGDSPAMVRIKTGQQARVRSGSRAVNVRETAAGKTILWREHRLMFEALPLEQVIAEFNRYNEPPAVIESERLKSVPISGVFRSHDRDSFLQFVSQMEIAEIVERQDGEIVLTDRLDD